MKQCNYSREALFQLNGIPPLGMSISLALQHLVAMIVGCVTPAIIIANALGLPVPSTFMRKFICRLRLNEVSRQ